MASGAKKGAYATLFSGELTDARKKIGASKQIGPTMEAKEILGASEWLGATIVAAETMGAAAMLTAGATKCASAMMGTGPEMQNVRWRNDARPMMGRCSMMGLVQP